MELAPTAHVLLAATGELVYALGAAILLHDVDAAAQRFFLGHCLTDSHELRAALDAHVEITAYVKQLSIIIINYPYHVDRNASFYCKDTSAFAFPIY